MNATELWNKYRKELIELGHYEESLDVGYDEYVLDIIANQCYILRKLNKNINQDKKRRMNALKTLNKAENTWNDFKNQDFEK